MLKSLLTRREILSGAAGIGLAGCGTSPTLDLIGRSFSGNSASAGGYPISNDQIRALPYASLGVRVGKSAPAVMILATYDGENLNWASADRVILVTAHGRLVKTVGLARDLSNTQWTADDPVLSMAHGSTVAQSHVSRFIDLRSPDDFGVAVESTVESAGMERISILGVDYDTRVVVEKIAVSRWRWSTQNRFWIDTSTGRVLRSIQRFCPEIEPLTLEILKPAAAVLS